MDYYTKISDSIMSDDRLSASEKLIFAKLSEMPSTKKEGYCYMKNSYFAEMLRCTVRTVQRLFRNLSEKGFISVEVNRSSEHGTERKIYIVMNQEVYPATLENEITETEEEETTLPEVPEVKPGDQEERQDCHGGVTKMSCNEIITKTSSPTEKVYIYRKNKRKPIPKPFTIQEAREEFEKQGYSGFNPNRFYDKYVNANGEWKEPRNKASFRWKDVMKTWNDKAKEWRINHDSPDSDTPRQTRPGYNSDYPREKQPEETAEERAERNARIRARFLSIGEDQEKTAPVEAENTHEEPQNEVFCDESKPETVTKASENESTADFMTIPENLENRTIVPDNEYTLPEPLTIEQCMNELIKRSLFRVNPKKFHDAFFTDNNEWRPGIMQFDIDEACRYASKGSFEIPDQFMKVKTKYIYA